MTLWSQRREIRRLRGELCDWGDLKTVPRTYWRPIWCRYDESFVWNHRILQDLVTTALVYLTTEEGLPESVIASRDSSPTPNKEAETDGGETVCPLLDIEGSGQRTHLTECLCALESMLLPVIGGFVKQCKIALPLWDEDNRVSLTESSPVIVTIISRRSQFRAGAFTLFFFRNLFQQVNFILSHRLQVPSKGYRRKWLRGELC